MIIETRNNLKRLALLLLAAVTVVTGSSLRTAFAAVTVPESIRVALYINASGGVGSPVATLQAADGMKLLWKAPDAAFQAADLAAGQAVRFAVDGYRAIMLETTSLAAAATVLKKIQVSSNAAFVTELSKNGKTVYQVAEGVYSSAAGAQSALTKWKNAGVAAGVQSLSAARMAGPWAVESGPYASLAEANAAAELFGNAGLDAFVAIKPGNGKIAYAVRIGQEATAAAAAPLQQAASAAAGQKIVVPDPSQPYALIRNDMTLSGTAGKPVRMYTLPLEAGAVLRAEPKGEAGIQLVERSKRTYRGSMELSAYAGALAVVNEVNLEHYLYSVVGTEVGAGWPPEAQKAQAVAARSYALAGGMSFKIAHVVDSNVSQVYNGIGAENNNSTAGVDATAGEVLTSNGRIIEALFSASAGGVVADAVEGWGNADPSLTGGAPSPDHVQQAGKFMWYKVATQAGQLGYVREDLLKDEGAANAAGVRLLTVGADASTLRAKPLVDSDALLKLPLGEQVVYLDKVPEQTDYSWVFGPFTPGELLESLNKRAKPAIAGPLATLEVSRRGPSGRAVELSANGVPVGITQPDSFRGALGGIKSTLIEIEETGRISILDGGGAIRELPAQPGELAIAGRDGQTGAAAGTVFILDSSGQLRAATTEPGFVITGKGWGHGVGMSQWGARGMAEQGSDYRTILLHYYTNVQIEKGTGQ